ncbi:VOC family protein [Paenibacillus sp. NPDC056579]|uniref:VOC family protein n=1 Tax=Paenibacillus sp. NPDC056579 TaxID=3345871 RepID=UPI00367ED4BB
MENKPVVKQIETIYIPVTNALSSAAWYERHLGLTFLRPPCEDQAQLKVGSNQSIFLIRTEERTTLNYKSIDDPEMAALTVEVYDIEDLHARMVENGVKTDSFADNGGCGISFHAYDPDGNKLHLWGGWPTKTNERG